MNKKTFEVGKTYLTRDGRKVFIKSYAGTTIIGVTRHNDGTEWTPTWYGCGSYFFSGPSPLDLMPEAIFEENTSKVESLKRENAALFSENIYVLAQIEELQKENGRLHVELREARIIARGMVEAMKQDSLDDPPMCKCNRYRAEDVHVCAFQRSFTNLTDEKYCTCCEKCSADCVKLAAQGMVDAAKISIPAEKCSCGCFYREEDKNTFPTTIGGIYGFYICGDCGNLRDLYKKDVTANEE